jgi:hypothetical protein
MNSFVRGKSLSQSLPQVGQHTLLRSCSCENGHSPQRATFRELPQHPQKASRVRCQSSVVSVPAIPMLGARRRAAAPCFTSTDAMLLLQEDSDPSLSWTSHLSALWQHRPVARYREKRSGEQPFNAHALHTVPAHPPPAYHRQELSFSLSDGNDTAHWTPHHCPPDEGLISNSCLDSREYPLTNTSATPSSHLLPDA